MFLLNFLGRRFLSGTAARLFTNLLVKRFRVSPGVANLIFVVLTELLARRSERPGTFPGAGKSPRR